MFNTLSYLTQDKTTKCSRKCVQLLRMNLSIYWFFMYSPLHRKKYTKKRFKDHVSFTSYTETFVSYLQCPECKFNRLIRNCSVTKRKYNIFANSSLKVVWFLIRKGQKVGTQNIFNLTLKKKFVPNNKWNKMLKVITI